MTEATQGMVGGGYYDAHSSFQAQTAESVTALLGQAVAALTMPANGEVTVADYGCSEGKNSMATVTAALDLLAARDARGLAVVHNDLPTNDWNTLSHNLSSSGSYLARYPQARALFAPRGFFEQVMPPASITLGTSGSAAHWLSRQPIGLNMPRSLYRSDAPSAELTKILNQAATDWQAFLSARADELQPGGVLLVQLLGADGSKSPVRVSAAGLLGLMNECALQLVDAGDVPQDVYARYCFPVVPRTVEEATAPMRGALADRLELLHCGLTPVASPYQTALDKTGDVAVFAKGYTAFTRAFSESSLRDGLFKYGKASADVLADRFYLAMERALTERPRDYPFDDLTLAIMVRRRG
jgi:hypothetical protein